MRGNEANNLPFTMERSVAQWHTTANDERTIISAGLIMIAANTLQEEARKQRWAMCFLNSFGTEITSDFY
jgi:hypothetical protein